MLEGEHVRVSTPVSWTLDVDTRVVEAEQGGACQSEHPNVVDTGRGHLGAESGTEESMPK